MVRRGGIPTRTNFSVVTPAPQRFATLDQRWALPIDLKKAGKKAAAEEEESDDPDDDGDDGGDEASKSGKSRSKKARRPDTGTRLAAEDRGVSLVVFRAASHQRHQVFFMQFFRRAAE